MKKIIQILLCLLLGITLSSCLHEDLQPCPPFKVIIAVKDKNYANVDKISLVDAVREDLPFREYVSTLCWRLEHLPSGRVVSERRGFIVRSGDSEITLDFGETLPFGDYELTVWGNLTDHGPLASDHSSLAFHTANDSGDDVYMTRDFLHYSMEGNTVERVELERTKGKLIIEKINIPSELKSSSKLISGLYANVDKGFNYDGETFVRSVTSLPGDPRVVTETILSPSVRSEGSTVSITFNGEPARSVNPFSNAWTRATTEYPDPDVVNITMKRNEITVLRYEWDKNARRFKIYVYINAGWEEHFELEL